MSQSEHSLSSPNIQLTQTPFIGFFRSLVLEHPELHCTHIDLDPDVNPAQNTLSLLEAITHPVQENQIAYRKGTSFIPRVQPCQNIVKKELTLNPQGSYLITGGFGALGQKVAEWLVSKGAKHLVLVGRKTASIQIPPATVETVACDISNAQEVNTLIQKFGHSWPELKGIIHAAGVLHDAPLETQKWDYFEEVFAPKVTGGWLLHQATLTKPLDFCVYFSSAASFLGNPGQTNYSAANAYLDALAYYRQQLGLPAQSICWGPWGEIGLAVKVNEQLQRSGINPLNPDLAIKALEHLLKTKTQVLVADINWKLYMPTSSFLSEVKTPTQKIDSKEGLLQQLQEAPSSDREKILREHIQKALRKILGQTIKEDQGFFDSGMDSLMAVQLKNQLQADIGPSPKLSSTLTFDYPTLQALTGYLQALLIPNEEVKLKQVIDPHAQKISEKEKELEKSVEAMSLDDILKKY